MKSSVKLLVVHIYKNSKRLEGKQAFFGNCVPLLFGDVMFTAATLFKNSKCM